MAVFKKIFIKSLKRAPAKNTALADNWEKRWGQRQEKDMGCIAILFHFLKKNLFIIKYRYWKPYKTKDDLMSFHKTDILVTTTKVRMEGVQSVLPCFSSQSKKPSFPKSNYYSKFYINSNHFPEFLSHIPKYNSVVSSFFFLIWYSLSLF